MSESIHEFVILKLQQRKGEWPEIAAATRVPYTTVKKIATRESKSPGVLHVEALARYFRQTTC